MNTVSKIPETFKAVRLALGLSQSKMAEKLGCSRVSVSKYETGDTDPGAEKYEKLLKLKELLSTFPTPPEAR